MTTPDLNIAQMGSESTWATAVAQTAKMMMVRDARVMPIVNDRVFGNEMRGSLAPAYVAMIGGEAGAGYLEQTATYEQILYHIESLMGIDSPSGAGPYTYEHEAPLTAIVSSVRDQTFAWGQGSDVFSLLGAVGQVMNFKVVAAEEDSEAVVRTDFIGKEVVADTLDSLSDVAVNPIMASHFAVYVDAWGGTIGSTQLDAAVTGIDLTVAANNRLTRHVGSTKATSYQQRKWQLSQNQLKLSLEFTSDVNAIVDAIIAGSVAQRQIRLKASNGANLDFQVDWAGTIRGNSVNLFTDDDGVTSLDLTLRPTYNSDLANWLKFTTINGNASVA